MNNDVVELWGCGFNQFNQIDDTVEDIFEPKRITTVLSRDINSIEVVWSGWADLLYITREQSKNRLIPRGFKASTIVEKLSSISDDSILQNGRISTFGVETLQGIIDHPSNSAETRLLQTDGTVLPFRDCNEIAMASTGHVAVIVDNWTSLSVYTSPEAVHSKVSSHPLITISIKPSNQDSSTTVKSFSCLTAGDAHFSFIVSHTWPSSTPDVEAYYKSIWSIRTDSRSLNDSAWIPLEEELSALEDASFVTVDTAKPDGMPIYCVDLEEPAEFVKCVSAGWITVGLCEDGKAYIFPFGRAVATIPGIRIGKVDFLNNVTDIAVGSEHIVVLRDTGSDNEVWTFGNNDHGQRGFPVSQTPSQGEWHKLDSFGPGHKVKTVVCAKWSTFFIIQNKN